MNTYVKKKISRLNDKMKERLESLLPENLYRLAKTTNNRCVLTEEDLEKIDRVE